MDGKCFWSLQALGQAIFFQGMGPLGTFNIHVKRIGIMAETLSKRYRGSRVGGA